MREKAYELYFDYISKWRSRKDKQSECRKSGNFEMALEHESFASQCQSAAKQIEKTFNLKFQQ
jgi:hypothetical protein